MPPWQSITFLIRSVNDYPVVGITWDQANAYCSWRSKKVKTLLEKVGIKSSLEFRLPAETEWEYAAMKKEKDTKHRSQSAYAWSEKKLIGRISDLANIG
jgi:formylglycine-generating enzyme required for sulfatase activity